VFLLIEIELDRAIRVAPVAYQFGDPSPPCLALARRGRVFCIAIISEDDEVHYWTGGDTFSAQLRDREAHRWPVHLLAE
jgi:hypothetical protein